MQDLKVIGVESGALVVATDAGSEYRLPVTLSLQSQLRQASAETRSTPGTTPRQRVSPRDIQASIRAGRTAEQVAADAGVEMDYVRRFEGPVLDERSFVLERARSVPVSIVAPDGSIGELSRFGDVIDSRLDEAEAGEREWTSYKDPATGWVVHVTYTASEVEREASWHFEPKKQGLAPLDGDAHTLSRQDGTRTTLVPRLRAVGSSSAADDGAMPAAPAQPDESGRFDSGAFELTPEPADVIVPEPPLPFDRTRDGRTAASFAAMNRAPEDAPEHNQTADLLEALRRRRGEREAARFDDLDNPFAGSGVSGDRGSDGGSGVSAADSRAAHPSTGVIRVIDVPLADFDSPSEAARSDDGGDHQDSASSSHDQILEPLRPAKPIGTHSSASRQRPSGRRTSPPSPDDAAPEAPRAKQASRSRKGRASMPSWDEIVFGARSDDDPA